MATFSRTVVRTVVDDKSNLAVKLLIATLTVFASSQSFAAQITIQFDLVKVTARAGAGADAGFTIYSAESIGSGPYLTKNGCCAIDFFKQSADARMSLNGFATGGIVANQFDFRYFGSVAAASGSVLRNLSNLRIKPDGSSENVAGRTIGDFEIKLAQPTQDSIQTAEGGNAFSMVTVAADKKSVVFEKGNIPVGDFPAAGNMGAFLWSFISPEGEQPKFPDVFFTDPIIPPDPTGAFKNIKYVGRASEAAPEPSNWVLAGLGALVLLGRHWRRTKTRINPLA